MSTIDQVWLSVQVKLNESTDKYKLAFNHRNLFSAPVLAYDRLFLSFPGLKKGQWSVSELMKRQVYTVQKLKLRPWLWKSQYSWIFVSAFSFSKKKLFNTSILSAPIPYIEWDSLCRFLTDALIDFTVYFDPDCNLSAIIHYVLLRYELCIVINQDPIGQSVTL